MSEQVRQGADVRRLADVRAGAGQRVKCSGTGYLVGPSLVLTCRHVLVNACAEHAERSGTSQGCGRCRLWPQLQVRIGRPADGSGGDAAEPVPVEASLLWQHPSQDVALLRLASPVPRAEGWLPVRWGRLVTGATQRYSGLGFPRLARYADRTRFIEPLAGEVNQLSCDYDGFALNQAHGPRDDLQASSPWVGVSGTAVFVESWLVGVVTVDDRRSQGRLRAVPVTRCLQDAQFVRLVGDDIGFVPVPEPVELAEVLQARPVVARAATPGSLLAAAAETVPFQGRTDQLRELVAWRDGGPAAAGGAAAGGAAGVSVRLVTGEGGQGKTRLARRFAADSRDAGWVTGFTVTASRATGDAQQQAGAEQLAARLRACIEPVLVVCDYAEASPLFAETLLAELLDRPPAQPVRVLLVARASGAWWQDLQGLLGDQAAQLMPLPPLGDDPGVRREGYLAAVRGLAAGLQRLPEPAVADVAAGQWPVLARQLAQTPPDLSLEFGNALTLQMTALLDLLQVAAGQVPSSHRDTGRRPEQQLAQHERDYHRRVAAGQGLLERDVLSPVVARNTRERHAMALLDRALAGLVMLGPCNVGLATDIGTLAHADRAGDVVEWLAALYPPPPQETRADQALVIGEIQPDRLAEILLGAILSTCNDTRTGNVSSSMAGTEPLLGQIAALVHDLSAAQQALFALVRTAAHPEFRDLIGEQTTDLIVTHPDPFAAAAPFLAAIPAHRGLLLAGLQRLGDRDPDALTTQAWRASALLPETSVSLAHLSAAITAILTDLFRALVALNHDAYLADLAMSLNNHALRLAETGRRAEAVPVSQEAVTLRRELTDLNRDAYLPNLAASLNNHAALLAETGRRAEAVPVSQEAVTLYRELTDLNRDAYLPNLAASLNNHAALLAETGRRAEAVPVSQEAVTLRRELTDLNRDAYLPNLAASLNNHAALLAETGRRAEAVPVSQEAVTLYRELTDLNRDAYLPDLAMSLNNHALRLAETGRRAEAVPVSQEAVTLYRELTDLNRDAYLPTYVQSLTVLGLVLVENTRLGEAVAPLVAVLGLGQSLPDESQGVLGLAVELLRRSYAEDPAEVTRRFQEVTGASMPEWLKEPPSQG
ncbi:tetratricopeptide repeat protein [Actinomadura formosensis]|uniref:tetratricopeptide repeat protein n=2 Tax=Actinomadura formosensis TaxID=60706 RepID=UPI0010417FC4|nr:tetratricopeptide repeat protein [Actinomadura formosensis]